MATYSYLHICCFPNPHDFGPFEKKFIKHNKERGIQVKNIGKVYVKKQ